MTPAQRAAVVAEAMSWLGTPYHHHGRVKGVGVDCLMLLAEVYERAGVAPRVEPGEYDPQWHLHRSEERYMHGLLAFCDQLPGGAAPEPGDIALYRFGRCFSHGAIVVENGLLVHSYLGRGVVLSRPDDEPIHGRIVIHWTLR